jgi:hypothetical protein
MNWFFHSRGQTTNTCVFFLLNEHVKENNKPNLTTNHISPRAKRFVKYALKTRMQGVDYNTSLYRLFYSWAATRTGLRGTNTVGLGSHTLVSSTRDSTRIAYSGWISNLESLTCILHIFEFIINSWLLHFQTFIFSNLLWGFWWARLVHLTDKEPSELPEQILVTYLKLESPDSNLVPGVTQLVPHLGLTKAWIPVFLRVPSGSTEIFFVSWIRKFTSRAHSCTYTRPSRTDPEVLPSRSLWSRHSSICSRRTWLENTILVGALFGCLITRRSRVVLLN